MNLLVKNQKRLLGALGKSCIGIQAMKSQKVFYNFNSSKKDNQKLLELPRAFFIFPVTYRLEQWNVQVGQNVKYKQALCQLSYWGFFSKTIKSPYNGKVVEKFLIEQQQQSNGFGYIKILKDFDNDTSDGSGDSGVGGDGGTSVSNLMAMDQMQRMRDDFQDGRSDNNFGDYVEEYQVSNNQQQQQTLQQDIDSGNNDNQISNNDDDSGESKSWFSFMKDSDKYFNTDNDGSSSWDSGDCGGGDGGD